MGIFDFFRTKKETIEKRKIKFEEIGIWLSEEKKKELAKEVDAISRINDLISQLAGELKEESQAMQKVDISKRKEPERFKVIVLENLSNYSGYVEKLVSDIEKIDRRSLERVIIELDGVFFEFAKKSGLSFEKASFLVGKELGKVQESIGRFFSEFKKIAEENKPVIQNLKLLDPAEKNLKKIEEIEQQKVIIIQNLEAVKNKIAGLEEKRRMIEKSMEKTRDSEDYLREKKRREEALLKKGDIEKEILNLNRIINFKSLKKTFHDDEKRMRIIKEYENDFSRIFESGKENADILSISSISNKSNMSNLLNLIADEQKGDKKDKRDEVAGIIEKIRIEKEESDKILNEKDSLVDGLESELEKTKSSIKDLDCEAINENAKIKKMDDTISSIKKSISEEIEKLNVLLL